MQIESYNANPSSPISIAAAAPNSVLRNTYLLLALSLVPTVAGALLGMSLNFSFFAGSPMIGFFVFMAIAFGFFYGIERTKNSGWGVAVLLAFTFFMGLMMSRLLGVVLKMNGGGTMIALAFGGTSIIFFGMGALAATVKRDLSGMGRFLMGGLLILILAGLANVFLQIPALTLTMIVVSIGIFSAFLVYDINRILTGGETNYITATLNIYLDLFNVFINLLQLLGITSSND